MQTVSFSVFGISATAAFGSELGQAVLLLYLDGRPALGRLCLQHPALQNKAAGGGGEQSPLRPSAFMVF